MSTISAISANGLSIQAPLSVQEQKLNKAAAEFESQLISSLWKSMKHTFSSDSTDSEEDSLDPAGQSIEDWGMEAMSGAVSRAGGFGIGKLIVKDLTEKLDHSQNGNLTRMR